jgi:hypothetical protein
MIFLITMIIPYGFGTRELYRGMEKLKDARQ